MFRVAALIPVLIVVMASTAFTQSRGGLSAALSPAAIRSVLPPLQPTPAPNPLVKKEAHPVRNLALIGAGIGLIIGVVAMNGAVDDCPVGRSCSTAGVGVPFAVMSGAAIGALLGLVAG